MASGTKELIKLLGRSVVKRSPYIYGVREKALQLFIRLQKLNTTITVSVWIRVVLDNANKRA